LRFEVQSALVAVSALNNFTLVFLSQVAAQVHTIRTLPIGAVNALK